MRSMIALLAATISCVPTTVTPQQIKTVCDLSDHPSMYIGEQVTVRGAIVEVLPEGDFLYGIRVAANDVCVIRFGRMADGGDIGVELFGPAHRLAGDDFSKQSWAVLAGTFRREPSIQDDRKFDYVLDDIAVQSLGLGELLHWAPP